MHCDFHTHRPPEDRAVTALVSAPERPVMTECCFWSLELHPWAEAVPPDWEAALPGADALGETGLDRVRGAPAVMQRDRWRRALAAAHRWRKPVVLHSVRADDELAADLRAVPELRVLRHGWNTPKTEALAAALERGWWIGLNRRTPDEALEFFRRHPQYRNRLAPESDDEPESLPELYARLAAALDLSETQLAALAAANFWHFLKG